MAANDDPKGRREVSGDSTIPLESAALHRPTPPGDVTCDLPPAESGAPATGATTCEFQYVPPADQAGAAPPDGTCEFTPDQMPGKPAKLPDRPGQTLAPGREQPATLGEATGEFQPATAAGGGPVLGTVDFAVGSDSDAIGRKTALRSPGALTQPTGVASPAAQAQRAGRYDLKKFHAKGGMGEVWLAEDPEIGRPVALKRMLKGRDKHKMNFVKEAQVTGQLEHPGVIPVHELSLDETGQPFYIMKFVHGQTLKEVIKEYHDGTKNAESPREVQWLRLLNIFLDLCQTIAYAHSRGVLHRDIKPDNVMVGAYGETLVLDWGLAKVIGEPDADSAQPAIHLSSDDVSVASITGTVKGTPYYFAPEVASGKVEQVDQVSDVYLLGATLYFMITNRTPREGKSLTQLLEDARKKVPVPPRQLDSTVSKPLDAICNKAMAFEKKDRYQSATALAEDVQRYLAGEPVSAYQENLVERTWRWVKRHRTGLGRATAAALIAAIGVTAVVLVRDAELRRVKDLEDAEIRRKEELQVAAKELEDAEIRRKDQQKKAELRQKETQAKADKLKREKDAGQEIENFKARTEEARFYAASANPVAENVATVDAAHAERKAKEAFDIADKWGPDLDKMPLAEKRADLQKELYDLLLEMAQLKSQRDIKGAQTYLERAVAFHPPTQGYYRLRARGLDAVGKKEDAELARKQETDAKAKATALDYYLLGEQGRIGSLQAKKGEIPEGKQDTLKDLQARREIILGKAMEMYREALRVDPNHYWSHFQLAVCYNGLGKHAEAAEALGACIVLQPKAPWAFSSRGLALSNIKDRQKEAEEDLDYALKLDPGFRPAQLHRAALYVSQKKFDKAEADFAAVLAPPDNQRLPQAFLARANMNMERKKYSSALPDFQQAIDARIPIHHTTYLYLARMYLIEEKGKEALENLTLYLGIDKKDDKSPRAYEARGRELRILTREFAQTPIRRKAIHLLALAQFEEALKRGGNTPSLFKELGNARQTVGQLKSAIDAYSSGIKLAPENRDLRIARGWAYVEANMNAKAKADFAVALAVDPDNAEAHAGFGYTAAMLKSPDEALEHATKATIHGGGDYLVLHNVACIYGALIDNDAKFAKRYQNQALAQLGQAVELWKNGNKIGPDEIDLIIAEGAFPASLKARPEFKKLIAERP